MAATSGGDGLLVLFLSFALCLPCLSHAFVAVAVEGYGRGRLIRTVDSGAHWTTVLETYIDLLAVATPSPYSVVAVGANGTIIAAATDVTLPTALTALYPNSSSVDQSTYLSSSVPAYSSYYPGSYSALVSQYASLAVQSNGSAQPPSPNNSVSQYYATLASPPYSTAWTPTSLTYMFATVSPVPTDDFRAVTFVSALLGIAVGTTGTVYRTVDGGWSWSSADSGIIRDLNALAFALSDGNGWTVMAAGNVGTLLVSRDTGLTWQQLSLSMLGNLYGIALYSSSQGIVCGDAGALLSTSDGGGVWTDLSQPQWQNFSFHSVAYHNSSTLYVAASRSTLLVSLDGGHTLTRVPQMLNNQLIRFGGLFLTPTVLAVAARNRLYAAFLDSQSSAADGNRTNVEDDGWLPLSAVNINAISGVAVLEAGVLTVAVPSFNLSAYLGSDLAFNVTLTNTGTDSLTVTNFSSSDPLVLFAPTTASLEFPLTLTPSSVAVVLDFVYAASQLTDTSTIAYYTNLTLLSNSPTQRTYVHFSLYLLPLPSSSSPSFLSQYWYVLALSLGAVAVLVVIFVRRRMRYVRRWNRRVLYEDEKIQFWGCWLLSQDIEHDSDSDFWSDESEQDELDDNDDQQLTEEEDEADEGEEGEGELDDDERTQDELGASSDRHQLWDASHAEHKEAHRRKQSKQPRHQLVWRDDEDDGWDDKDNDDEAGDEWQEGDGDADEDTDSSISDPDDFFYQRASSARPHDGDHLRHRAAAAGRETVFDSRPQSHREANGSGSNRSMHGRRSSALMADVARLAAVARQHGGSIHHGH